MKIEDLMTRDVVTVSSNALVQESVKLMNKNGIGCVLVINLGEVNGILTERDILKRVVEKGRNPKETRVSEIMTKHVIFGNPNMELIDATKLMFEKKVKKLPIRDGNRLVGLVTLTDIARVTSVDKETMELVEKLSNMHLIN